MSEPNTLTADSVVFEAVRPPVGRAIGAAALAAVLGASLWALMVIVTDHSFGIAAAAAALGRELTVPGVAQTVILTRYGRRASPMPAGEALAELAAHGATLVIHLGAQAMEEIAAALAPHYGPDCPVAVVARASWPDEFVLRGTLATIADAVRDAGIRRTATILVGQALAPERHCESHLYSPARPRAGAGTSP